MFASHWSIVATVLDLLSVNIFTLTSPLLSVSSCFLFDSLWTTRGNMRKSHSRWNERKKSKQSSPCFSLSTTTGALYINTIYVTSCAWFDLMHCAHCCVMWMQRNCLLSTWLTAFLIAHTLFHFHFHWFAFFSSSFLLSLSFLSFFSCLFISLSPAPLVFTHITWTFFLVQGTKWICTLNTLWLNLVAFYLLSFSQLCEIARQFEQKKSKEKHWTPFYSG